eukprot:8023726-Pyramimonas_sp.AAC.1
MCIPPRPALLPGGVPATLCAEVRAAFDLLALAFDEKYRHGRARRPFCPSAVRRVAAPVADSETPRVVGASGASRSQA